MAVGWRWWRASSPLVARGAAALYVAGVALAHIHLRFAWQAWHLATSTCVWHGSLAKYNHYLSYPPLLRNYWVGMRHTTIVIGGPCPSLYSRVGIKYPKVTLTAPKYDLAWSPLVAQGTAALCVAGVALAHIHHRFARQAWHLATSTCVWRGRRGPCGTGLGLVALGRRWSPLVAVSRPGRRGTLRAGVALGDIYLRLAWQAWRLWHWAGSGDTLGRC